MAILRPGGLFVIIIYGCTLHTISEDVPKYDLIGLSFTAAGA